MLFVNPVTSSVAPVAMVILLVLGTLFVLEAASLTVPVLIVVGPTKVSAPDSVKVPAPL